MDFSVRLRRALLRFHRDEGGAVLIWFTLMILVIVSLISLALEGAAFMNMHSSLQEVADAAALSGAVELDGAKGARSRATDKAQNYLGNTVSWSNVALSGTQIASVKFYASIADLQADTEASSDQSAAFIKVTTVSRSYAAAFKKAISTSSTMSTTASAAAVSQYASCAPVQSFLCNPFEDANTTTTGDGSSFLGSSAAKVGDMFKLVNGSGGAPGDWGLIQPPGTKGNPKANQPPWWSKPGIASCDVVGPGDSTVLTSPGNQAGDIVEGANVRFDSPSNTSGVISTSAPVVISGFSVSGNTSDYTCNHTGTSATPTGPSPGKLAFSQTNACGSTTECTAEQKTQWGAYQTYCTNGYGSCPLPRDRVFAQLGTNGNWGSMLKGSGVNIDDLKAYWTNHHTGSLPSSITTRYQLYQQEVNDLGNAGGLAAFTSASELREPSTPQCDKSKPAGGLERRLINVAIIDCKYWGIKGRKGLPLTALTARFFMTEPAQSDGAVYGELVDIVGPNATGSPVHHMVRLVR